MKDEVDSATGFLSEFVVKSWPSNLVKEFRNALTNCLTEKYARHWHPQLPNRGSAFRSITIDKSRNFIDPVIKKAVRDACLRCGLSVDSVENTFPSDLTLWVDPKEVCYRIGEYGSIGLLYAGPSEDTSDSESDSGCSSVSDSPRSSPTNLSYPPTPPRSGPYGYRQQPVHSIYYQCGQEASLHSRFTSDHYNGMQTMV